MKTKIIMGIISGVLFISAFAFSQTPPGQRGKIIAQRINVSHEYVMSLWDQGYSFGAILHVGLISLATGIPIDDILRVTESSPAWGVIAPYFGTRTLHGYSTVGDFMKSPRYIQPIGEKPSTITDPVPITSP